MCIYIPSKEGTSVVTSEFSREYAAEQIRRSRHPFRRLIKEFYIRNLLKEIAGPSIDFACGAGQLLARLPAGSIGVEVNACLIEYLTLRGLNVIRYNTDLDQFSLSMFQKGQFSTFIMAHLLEHFADAAQVLRTLLNSCRRIGIQQIILVLPGWKGYLSDRTHKTFVDARYLQANGLWCCEGYRQKASRYFPFNREAVGRYFIYHELVIVYDRVS